MKPCDVCGQQAMMSIGGAVLCRAHYEDVVAEIDALRAQGKQVNAAGIARRMYRELNESSNYMFRDIPKDLMDAARHRAVDDNCSVREVILSALRSYFA